MSERNTSPQGPDHSGGGPQGEPIEGSYTDGGSLPGHEDEGRSFGAGRQGNAGANQDPDNPQPGKGGPPVGGANNGSVEGLG